MKLVPAVAAHHMSCGLSAFIALLSLDLVAHDQASSAAAGAGSFN
jgi:hypothetical protein